MQGVEGNGATLAVIGCGYVGLVTAACFAEMGHSVTGVEADPSRLACLSAGQATIREPGLQAILDRQRASGRLRFTADIASAIEGVDAVFVCVNTPATPAGAADMRFVRAAATGIAAALGQAKRLPLIVNKSTSPIGTADTIEHVLRRSVPVGRAVPPVVTNPEFLREGHAVDDFFHPRRIVVGAGRESDARRVAALYRGIDAPVVLTDPHTAEMIKYVANAFLATRVSFANEVARLCEALDVEAAQVLAGAGMDPRVGSAYLQPGIGYGGSCLPKDVAALCHTGECAETPMRLLAAVQQVNATQRQHPLNTLRSLLHGLDGRQIAVWGVTFKGETDDLRDSPALHVIALLRNEGARVVVYDPSLAAPLPADLADETRFAPIDATRDAHALAVLSDWAVFRDVDLARVRSSMAGNVLYDGRNILDRVAVEQAGLVYRGVGRTGTRTSRTSPRMAGRTMALQQARR